VLVVVHHRNTAGINQTFFYLEALRSLDVLQIYAPETWLERTHYRYELGRVGFVYFQIDCVKACKNFEQQSLAFHNGFRCRRADITEPEHCCAVGYNGHGISPPGIFIGIVGVIRYFKARERHARRVRQR
jgi:hypothetical protein